MARVEAVIVDLDGVIRTWPARPVTAIEVDFGLPIGAIDSAAFGSPVLAAMLAGSASRRAWQSDVARDLEARYGRPGREAASRWAHLRGMVDRGMLELVRDVRLTCPVALLSNAGHELMSDLRALGIEGAFDVVASSAGLGFVKPDPRAFLRTAELLSRPPSSCLAIDDLPLNVVAARALGMAAIQHRSAARTRRALARFGIGFATERPCPGDRL